MSNLETILYQIEALKKRERQVRALLRGAGDKTHQREHEVRSALTAVRQDQETPDQAAEYRKLITQIRRFASTTLPRGAKVLVISRGDNALLQLPGREGWHFPQIEGGCYAGHYPADSKAAIEHLEALRDRGAGYLLIPGTAAWWLTHYTDFHCHLESRYLCLRSDETCILYALSPRSESPQQGQEVDGRVAAVPPAPVAKSAVAANGHHNGNGAASSRTSYTRLVEDIRQVIQQTIPGQATVLVVSKGDEELVKLDGCQGWHFPQSEDGIYAGHYPADSTAAIKQLEMLRLKGAGFLVFPRTAFWWLVHYEGLRRHLDTRYQRMWYDANCIVYSLAAHGMFRRLLGRLSLGLGNGR